LRDPIGRALRRTSGVALRQGPMLSADVHADLPQRSDCPPGCDGRARPTCI